MELTERVNPMRVTDNETGREYILDFTRETVKMAESRGFDWDDVPAKPMTLIPIVWHTAFLRYEPRMSVIKTDKILDDMGGIQPKQLQRLRQLYDQAMSSLVAEDTEDGTTKNAKVTVTLD